LDPARPHVAAKLISTRDGLTENDVRAICLDRRGNLWLGEFGGGVAKFEHFGSAQQTVRRYTVANGLVSNYVRTIFEDHSGRTWIGTRYGGLTVIENDSLRSITVKDGLLSNAVWSIGEDSSGRIWLGTQLGLQSLVFGPSPAFTSYDYASGASALSCAVSRDGLVCAY